jgi:hypothetical protein
MKKLVIKKGDEVIFNGYDIYNVDPSLPPQEFRDKLVETCNNDLGMKFDHYLDYFGEFDNAVDENNTEDIEIKVYE